MVLKIKERKTIPKKVLIYGLDGSGKSTFAEQYCKENDLNAICLDVDDTNFTNIPLVEFDRSNNLKVQKQVLEFIADVKQSDFDTVIIDGVSSLLNLLVSNGKGLNKYGDRTVALNKIINELARSKLNFILIGQIDLDTAKDEVSVAVVNVNSIVNEKYYCYIDSKGNYLQEVKKFRSLNKVIAEAKTDKPKTDKPKTDKPKQNKLDNLNDIAKSILAENNDLLNAKVELARLLKAGIISNDECPKILKIIEEVLA